MDIQCAFNEYDLISMMYENQDINIFKSLFDKDRDTKNWSELLHACYWEQSYESYGGDEGDLENPPINEKRLKYLEKLITFLEESGIEAADNSPGIKFPLH